MADTKVSVFTALTGANSAPLDLVPIIDVSDVSQGAGGTAKTITRQEFQTYNAGTLTTDVKVLDLSVTWNAAGVTFTGIKLNATSSASAAGSLLMDLQLDSTSKVSINKAGRYVTAPAGVPAAGAYSIEVSGQNAVGISRSSVVAGLLLHSAGTTSDTANAVLVVNGSIHLENTKSIVWDNGAVGQPDSLVLAYDAANTLAQRNTTNAQTFNLYGTYTSASSYHRCAIKTAKTTLSNVSGATVTATALIPDGAFLIGVTTRVNTTCTTATGYTVGDGVDADLWGVAATVSSGTATKSSDFTAVGACGLYTAAQSVVITATGGSFDGTGAIEVVAHYLTTEAD